MDPNRPSRSLDKFVVRMPSGLRERIAEAATKANQSMNALIVSVLEREFPHPTIDLRDVAMFLETVSNDAEDHQGRGPFIEAANNMLAQAKNPWMIGYEDGTVRFYPCADPASRTERADVSMKKDD